MEGLTNLVIKINGLLSSTWHLDYILVLDVVPLSLVIQYLGHPNENIGFIG